MARVAIPEVIEHFHRYFIGNPTWGSLHIVLDDGNINDGHVQFCINYAVEKGDEEGVVLGEILLRMSKTQRSKIPRMVDELVYRELVR